jgi:signal transduction histidine kinase
MTEEVLAGQDAGRQLRVSVEGTEHKLVLDSKVLRHVFTNLVSNAFKYSPDAEPVDVSVIGRADGLYVEVRDRGIGIPEDQRQTLFEPFKRCSNVGDIPGTGLGLALVKQVVSAHRGTLDVVSQVGEGTVFSVFLPDLRGAQ